MQDEQLRASDVPASDLQTELMQAKDKELAQAQQQLKEKVKCVGMFCLCLLHDKCKNHFMK